MAPVAKRFSESRSKPYLPISWPRCDVVQQIKEFRVNRLMESGEANKTLVELRPPPTSTTAGLKLMRSYTLFRGAWQSFTGFLKVDFRKLGVWTLDQDYPIEAFKFLPSNKGAST